MKCNSRAVACRRCPHSHSDSWLRNRSLLSRGTCFVYPPGCHSRGYLERPFTLPAHFAAPRNSVVPNCLTSYVVLVHRTCSSLLVFLHRNHRIALSQQIDRGRCAAPEAVRWVSEDYSSDTIYWVVEKKCIVHIGRF